MDARAFGAVAAFRFADSPRWKLNEVLAAISRFSAEKAEGELAASDRTDSEHQASPPPGRDRLPLVILGIFVVVAFLAGGGIWYLVSQATGTKGEAPATAASSTTAPTIAAKRGRTRGAAYAGVSREQARRFAAIDTAKLVKSSLGSTLTQEQMIAEYLTINSRLSRTRCFHDGHWGLYWRVSFAGASPMFESRDRGLLFCNHNTHVIETTPPYRH
jgi:hypothetical protein